MSGLILPGEGIVIASVKTSDTYVQVRLLQPVRFRPNEEPREIGDTLTCNLAMAEHLADRGLAAILYEKLSPRTPLFALGEIKA